MDRSKVETVQEKGQDPVSVPFIVHESALARAERHIKRMWIALIIVISVLFVTNGIWIWYISQYDFVSYTVTSDSTGHANYIGNDGNIYNGESSSEETNETQSEDSTGQSN